MLIPDTTYSQYILDLYTHKVRQYNRNNSMLQEARQQVIDLLTAPITAYNRESILKTAELQNEIEETELEIQ